MTFISYAQNFEDVMLWRAFKHLDSGFYVDVGAAWPDIDSVTKAFYERGWHGINIEPNPDLFSQLNSTRSRDTNLQLAISTQNGEAEISILNGTGLSTLSKDIANQHINQGWPCEKINVITKTLSSIWESYVPNGQDVHFLKLDVEGSEELVIKSNDWSKNRPWIVVVESTLPLSQIENYELWQSQLLAFNYKFVYADGLNRFYLADEHSSLSSCFTYPPNYFDGFQLASQHTAEAELNRTRDLKQKLQIKLSDIQEDNLYLENQNRQLSADLHLLANSRSMRITAPLRLLFQLGSRIKGWIRSHFPKEHPKKIRYKASPSIGKSFVATAVSLLRYLPKKAFTIALKKIFFLIYRSPQANRIVRSLVRKIPRLESALRQIYTKTTYSVSGQEFYTYPKELSHLSPTARRIYFDLKQAINKYHGGEH